jgi:hypothetical protein
VGFVNRFSGGGASIQSACPRKMMIILQSFSKRRNGSRDHLGKLNPYHTCTFLLSIKHSQQLSSAGSFLTGRETITK